MVTIKDARKYNQIPITRVKEGEFVLYKKQLYIVTDDEVEYELVNVLNGKKINLVNTDVIDEIVNVTITIED